MFDDRPLAELINSRFDDLVSRIDDLKRDMIRTQDKHELEDKERFQKHDSRLTDIEKLKWKLTGAISLAFLVLQGLWKLLEKYT